MKSGMAPPMTPEQEQFALCLAGRGDLELGIVFGSVARGEASPRSDLDIALAGFHLRIQRTEEI